MSDRPSDRRDGVTLSDYVETRFTLLVSTMNERAAAQDQALVAFAESTKAAAVAFKSAVEAAQVATDLRYQQRFDAQSDALSAAFASQQQAMQTAFNVAEKAVQAALAAADRAVSKAELAADKRFEAMNELRQMLEGMVRTLMTRTESEQQFEAMGGRIVALAQRVDNNEARLNKSAGQQEGGSRTTTEARANLSMLATIISTLALLGTIAVAMATR